MNAFESRLLQSFRRECLAMTGGGARVGVLDISGSLLLSNARPHRLPERYP
jgi:hypothetical protein